ncbi:hypothetical protein V502_03212 [Pseudogymnoascus sp. VKM F-4520 (FW-2644)]|nr:hypothetical protein V502_03212 [Pseudogymnoascus sp. VKM F-4520 (FW-2644)]
MPKSISANRSSPDSAHESNREAEKETGKRTPRACDGCRQRKVKCDAVKPASLQRLSRRIEELEQSALRQKGSSDSLLGIQSYNSTTLSNSAQSSFHSLDGSKLVSPKNVQTQESQCWWVGCFLLKQQIGACKLSDTDSAETFPLLSRRGLKWIESRTGDPLGLGAFAVLPEAPHDILPLVPLHQSLHPRTCPPLSNALPPRRLVEQYANMHFSSIMHAIVPFVEPVRFNQTVALLYSTPTEASYPPDRRAFIHIFLVFAAKIEISHLGTALPPVDEDACVRTTLALLPEILGGCWTITGLETILMLAGYYAVRGNLQFCEVLHADAVRIMFALGGHIRPIKPGASPESSPNSADSPSWSDSHLRSLFWMCYLIDKFLTQRTGRAPTIRDDMCDLDLPTSYINQFSSSTLLIRPAGGRHWPPLFSTNIELAIIKDKIFNRLFSHRAMQVPDAELLKNIRELDQELDSWKSTIPPQFRPHNIHAEPIPNPVELSMHVLLLHIEYYYCVAWVHSASVRCRISGGIKRGVEGSIALSVVASRLIITYLSAMQHVVGLEPFWVIVHHPLSSVITIFSHVLQDPLASSGAQDLAFLRCASDIFARLSERSPTGCETRHLEVVKDFVQELSRLAECALQKAFKERSAEEQDMQSLMGVSQLEP